MSILRRFRRVVTLALCLAAAPLVAAQLSSDVTISDRRGADLSLSVFSAAYRDTSDQATVLIGAEVEGLADRLELRYLISHVSGGLPEQIVSVPLADETARGLARREGVRVLKALALAPGQYRVRVTAQDMGNQRVVDVMHDLDVPALTDSVAPVKMSGVVLSSSAVGGHTHAEVDDDHRMLPILGKPPSARRQFSQSEKVEVHAEFYEDRQPEFEFDQQIDVITRVKSLGGQVVWETKDNGTSEALSGGRFGYIHSTLIPVSTIAPGPYVLEVAAVALNGVPGYVSRSVPFTIR